MTHPNSCAICGEHFREPEFARRCEAQGVPTLVYMVGDVLLRTRGRGANKPPLLVVRSYRVRHGTGVVCPVDGPCEHAATYVTGPYVEQDWQRLWGMYLMSRRRSRRMTEALI